MIIARLTGGLGNQMFIYAAARALALRNGSDLLLDTRTGFCRDTYGRKVALQHLSIHARYASGTETWYLPLLSKPWLDPVVRRALRLANSRLSHQRRFYLRETTAHDVDRRLLAEPVRGTVYLDGYWQNERYFSDAEPAIRRDFQLSAPADPRVRDLGGAIRSCNSVSLHARRIQPNLGPLPVEYYQKAIRLIAERVRDPRFFCFSDDPEWLRTHLRCQYPIYISKPEDNPRDDHADFWLMTQCRHHIVANSTFSWWSAWLGTSEEKLVFCPEFSKWGQVAVAPSSWIELPDA